MELTRGIYMAAFGEPARECAKVCIASIRQYLPDVPVMLCSSEPLGVEDHFAEQPDSDIGGRGAKLMAYELTPPDWDTVLYLDADTEIISSDIEFYYHLLEAGWEFVICKDPMREDVAQLPRHKYDEAELVALEESLGTLHTLMLNGGVWAFRRTEPVREMLARWQVEWERFGRRDQGALLRALYAGPLKIVVLGNEWNYFPQYSARITDPAALMHYPGRARRWAGQIPGRLDGELAWLQAERFQGTRRETRRQERVR